MAKDLSLFANNKQNDTTDNRIRQFVINKLINEISNLIKMRLDISVSLRSSSILEL